MEPTVKAISELEDIDYLRHILNIYMKSSNLKVKERRRKRLSRTSKIVSKGFHMLTRKSQEKKKKLRNVSEKTKQNKTQQ